MKNQPVCYLWILCLLLPLQLFAQKKNASLAPTPEDSRPIVFKKSAAMQDDNFMMRWKFLVKKRGDKAPDFTIRYLNGKPFNLYEELQKGKPVLLVNGSYTCDISRGHIGEIADITHKYKKKLRVYIIHTIEAHPSDAPSPYSVSNKIWPSRLNVRDGIEAKSPKTYRERRELTSKWIEVLHIEPKVLVDSADNLFWNRYGQAPNMAFLISPEGKISASQIFFEEKPMEKEIDKLLDM